MFGWLKKRLVDWANRYPSRESERLLAEALKMKADVLKLTGEERIRLTPDQLRRLNELRQKIDPEVLKRIDVLSDAELASPGDRDQKETGDSQRG